MTGNQLNAGMVAETKPSAPSSVMPMVAIGGAAVSFRDPGAADHVGWHEITAAGDRMTVSRAGVPAASLSARLTAYPKDMLSSPLDQRSASFTVTPGGPPLAAAAGTSDGAARVLPRGVDRLTQAFTDLVARRHLTPGFALVALLIAVALGAIHALAPGHGKTIMAAQAVSRGRRSLPDITILGLTVTVTHTLGVLVLGLLVAGGSSVVTPGLFPWLGTASGALVAMAGCALLRRALRPRPAHEHSHSHSHGHAHTDMPRRGAVVVMGFAGGLMPSPSAVVVLLGAVAGGPLARAERPGVPDSGTPGPRRVGGARRAARHRAGCAGSRDGPGLTAMLPPAVPGLPQHEPGESAHADQPHDGARRQAALWPARTGCAAPRSWHRASRGPRRPARRAAPARSAAPIPARSGRRGRPARRIPRPAGRPGR